MTRWGTPEGGALVEESVAVEAAAPPERRAVAFGRSTFAPVILALTTITGLAAAVLALLPAAMSPRPAGRLGPRAAVAPPDADTESESLAR